ncbi:MAG: HAMP domain-containing sensor histidine kinase [bacterium]
MLINKMEKLISLHYCYDYFINQTSVGLIMYSHIPTALMAIFFGLFILLKKKALPNIIFFIVCIFFAIWCLLDLGSWFVFFTPQITMFTWGLSDLFAILFFFFSYYFIYSFIKEKDLPLWQKIIGIIILLPTFIWTFFGSNLLAFNFNNCEAIENNHIIIYPYYVEGFFILSIILFVIIQYRKIKDEIKKKEILFSGLGVIIFLLFFFSATLFANHLSSDLTYLYAYNYEIYGLFGMPLLLAFLVYIIVKFKAFDIKMIMAQALVWILVIVIGSEFSFITTLTNQVLVGVTLIISSILGFILVRSVKKEIIQKEKIKKIAEELEITNEAQTDTLRFITHQIRGVFTNTKMALSLILDGDYGPISESLKKIMKDLFDKQNEGVESVQSFLLTSNIDNGNPYMMEYFDFYIIVSEISSQLKTKAIKKDLDYEVNISADKNFSIMGDKTYLSNAISILIDNAICYTKKGSIKITLSKTDKDTILFSVEDTGIGISKEDEKKLFTKYGHGKNSRLINVDSNGLGLYLVKKIIDAHNGQVWEKSEVDKGTTFFIKLFIKN